MTPSPPQPHAASPLARLPLQIGTTATWSAARAALTLFPGIAILGSAIDYDLTTHDPVLGMVIMTTLAAVPGVLLLVYAITHLVAAVRTRASDLLLDSRGFLVDGGRLHGQRIDWRDLQAPYALVEETSVRRLTLPKMLLSFLSLAAKGEPIESPVEEVWIWRLHVYPAGQRRLVAETERPIERESMRAAATSMKAVVEGQRYVEQAPAILQQILVCPSCGGPAVPDDVPAVACGYCRAPVPMPPQVRQQAAGVKAMAQSRARTAQMIARLRNQPAGDAEQRLVAPLHRAHVRRLATGLGAHRLPRARGRGAAAGHLRPRAAAGGGAGRLSSSRAGGSPIAGRCRC